MFDCQLLNTLYVMFGSEIVDGRGKEKAKVFLVTLPMSVFMGTEQE